MDTPLTSQQELDQVLAAEQHRQQAGLGPDFQLLMKRAHWLEVLSRYEEALQVCDLAGQVLLDLGLPDEGDIAGCKARICSRLGRLDDSLASSLQAEQLRSASKLPPDWQNYHWRSVALMDKGEVDQSLEASQRAEAIISEQGLPQHPGILNLQGVLNCMIGKYEESLQAYGKARQIHIDRGLPVHPGLLSNIGVTLFQIGRPEEAIVYLEEAGQQFREQGIPPMSEYHSALGLALAELGRFEEALTSSKESDRIRREQGREEDWNWHVSTAMIYYKAGRKAEAIVEMTNALLVCGRRGIQLQGFVVETLQDWMSPKPEKLVEEQLASQPEAVQPVPDSEKKHDVFICYRRDPGHTHSMLLQAHMEMKGKTVFRDQDGLSSGRFEEALRDAIRYSRHMVILLTPDFFVRCCTDDDDVVRKEIATALHSGTHIIPVKMEGFSWPASAVLPEDISEICGINAMSHSAEFYTAFIDKLVSWME